MIATKFCTYRDRCDGMCKYLLWSNDQEHIGSKTKCPSNSNYEWKDRKRSRPLSLIWRTVLVFIVVFFFINLWRLLFCRYHWSWLTVIRVYTIIPLWQKSTSQKYYQIDMDIGHHFHYLFIAKLISTIFFVLLQFSQTKPRVHNCKHQIKHFNSLFHCVRES